MSSIQQTENRPANSSDSDLAERTNLLARFYHSAPDREEFSDDFSQTPSFLMLILAVAHALI
jgi:hypothetical protein